MFRFQTRRWSAAMFVVVLVTTLINKPLSAQDVGEAKRLRVLFVMDTDAAQIGGGVRADLDNLVIVMNEVFKDRRDKLVMEQMTGGNVTPDGVLKYYERLKEAHGQSLRNETLLFIYSGHGGLDTARGQFLAMERGRLYRSDLRRALDATDARLTVILTNCCSNIAGVDPPNRRVPAEWEAFKQLFFQHRGMVDITAAEDGTIGWVNNRNGGFFTQCLVKLFCEPIAALDRNGNGFVTWSEFSHRLTQDTNQLFLKARRAAPPNPGNRDHISNFQSQTPQTNFTGFSTWTSAHSHYASRGYAYAALGGSYSQAGQAIIDRAVLNCATASQMVWWLKRAESYYRTAGEFFDYAARCAGNSGAAQGTVNKLQQPAASYSRAATSRAKSASDVVALLEAKLRREQRLNQLQRQFNDLRRSLR